MSLLNEFRERSWVVERFGRWVQFYLGHTSKRDRARSWQSDLSRGVYVRPWGSRAVGLQWRRSAKRTARREGSDG